MSQINGKPFIRYTVPGHPHQSVWIPAGQPAPAGHRADREGVSWAAVIVALLAVLVLAGAIIGAAAWIGHTMAEQSVPAASTAAVSDG